MRRCLFGAVWLLSASGSAALATEEAISFVRDIAPIFEQHCLSCHSPGNAKGEISLATIDDLAANDFIVGGDPGSSYVVELITSVSERPPQMPKEGAPLAPGQVELIRRWIEQGADWPDDVTLRARAESDASWWSLQPVSHSTPPWPHGLPESWKTNPIDRFVFARLAERGLQPNPPADRRTLLRRATYDLIGLPPTPEEVQAFLTDRDPLAYERRLEALLGSPQYGERWGRHWLDVVRFGESNGFERNVIIEDLWPFRDYVIRSLNHDKPFDQFIREHLAGDSLAPGQPGIEIGSAFLVCGPYDNVGNSDPVQAAQIRADTIDEIIRATGEAFLGLTVGCARCHDHKFDPILQRDYYSWYSIFSGVRHGSRVVATAAEKAVHAEQVTPLSERRAGLTEQRRRLHETISRRGHERAAVHQQHWQRPPVSRQGTEEKFPPVTTRFVRLVSEAQDENPQNATGFGIDEFEVWSPGPDPRNVALARAGATARGPSRQIEDFPGAYGPQLAIDGKTGERFLATAGQLTIEFPEPTRIERVVFSSARGEAQPEQPKFACVADYRIEISPDGNHWTEVAHGRDRQPVNEPHRSHRLLRLETTAEERTLLADLDQQIAAVEREISLVRPLPTAWIGDRVAADAQGPFHVFLGGSPQRPGETVSPSSLSALADAAPRFELSSDAAEAALRRALADWIVHPANPLTARVLANRLWHYHFGVGIVDTPNDFGYMGGQPTHPELLDWLAQRILDNNWRIKALHKEIMLSQTYRQSSQWRQAAAQVDGDARLLWRYSPRRLSAEEIRDTLLLVCGQLNLTQGGPGFRLYRYLEDNVATYVPLDRHGPATFRRAVYHQNARAAPTDLMTDFDQPDCAYSAPRRVETTTPLQALTMLNHDFTLELAGRWAQRLRSEAGASATAQVQRAYALGYGRMPSDEEQQSCVALVESHSLEALCRVLLNTSELIYVE